MPERIQRRRVKGWRMPAGSRYVGRGSEWGNVFVVGQRAIIDTPSIFVPLAVRSTTWYQVEITITPESAVALHRAWVLERPAQVEQIRAEMAGQDLVCWCALDAPCHADTYLEIANGKARPDWSALRDACDEYCTAYMGEDDTDMPPALDKIRAALRGEDPYNPESWARLSREGDTAADAPNQGGAG